MLEALGMNPSTMATAELMVHRKDIEAAFRERDLFFAQPQRHSLRYHQEPFRRLLQFQPQGQARKKQATPHAYGYKLRFFCEHSLK